MDRERIYTWVVRAAWAALPFIAGPALSGALHPRAIAVRTAASVFLWAVWAVVLVAALVLHPMALTAVRVATPAAVLAAAWALAVDAGPAGIAAVAVTLLAFVMAFLPDTGVAFVNGPAYPNERRFLLRVPAPILLGPIVLTWAAVALLPMYAVVLLASRRWVTGGAVGVLALAGAPLAARALYGLARRWVVFVPAGLVIHDPMTLADPVLFRRQTVEAIDAASAPLGPQGVDATQRAAGLALDVILREETPLVLAGRRRSIGATVSAGTVRFAPTLPGAVLEEARRRRLALGRSSTPRTEAGAAES